MVNISTGWIVALVILAVWDVVWKAIAAWRAGQNQQLIWFIVILVVNSVGIIPILYLLLWQKGQKP